jgi:hypothetical protein
MPVERLEPLRGEEAHPDEERRLRPAEEIVEPLRNIEEGFLEHVRWIDAAAEEAVEAQLHHGPETLSVLHEKLGQDLLAFLPIGAQKESLDFSRLLGHQDSAMAVVGKHTHYTEKRKGSGTGNLSQEA